MSAIGKLTGAWLSASQETTFALVNTNIDFSLMKFESPEEFRGLGAALSTHRRKAAEDGPMHVVARKLGALFDRALPSTPDLVRAYGIRASEIAEKPTVNPRGTKDDGFFIDHVGVDGTSIWAAATSGNAALGVHLLACLIARVWNSPQAISIWMELIEARKKELIMVSEREPSNLAALSASQITLTSKQIGSWDASARAWLEAGDKAMGLKHVQQMLIVNNVNIPVTTKMNVYEGVLYALRIAMTTVDNLIKGMPQSPQDGAALLGLSSWHIYPDMLVLGRKTVEIKQNDDLVGKGGRLTLGLKINGKHEDRGVFWSLPLAHLRYYGEPVLSTRTMVLDGSRISFNHFLQVVLGSAISTWSKYGTSDLGACSFVRVLWEFLQQSKQRAGIGPASRALEKLSSNPWLASLARAAKEFENSEGSTRKMLGQLMSIGRRRSSSVLGLQANHPTPFFGLCSCATFFPMLNGREEQIALLRSFAASLNVQPDDIIIKYKVTDFDDLGRAAVPFYEYTTALPYTSASTKAKKDGPKSEPSHTRWMRYFRPSKGREVACQCKESCHDSTCICLSQLSRCSKACHRGSSVSCYNRHNTVGVEAFNRAMIQRRTRIEKRGERVFDLEKQDVEKTDDLIFSWAGFPENFTSGDEMSEDFSGVVNLVSDDESDEIESKFADTHNEPPTSFQILFGDPETAALYLRQDRSLPKRRAAPYGRIDDLSLIEAALKSRDVNSGSMAEYFLNSCQTKASQKKSKSSSQTNHYYRSLRALAYADHIYSKLPDATLSLGTTVLRPISEGKWARSILHTELEENVKITNAFSCITLFETGRIDLEPQIFEKVMAVCSGNSLYVAGSLLRDPWSQPHESDIRLLVGNVGRPGVSLLVPPAIPRIHEMKYDNWHQINHEEFNGQMDDSFQTTTLHLSFTGAETPVDLGIYGDRDAEVCYVESLVSVHDRGEWIADLDVLGMSRNPRFMRVASSKGCHHSAEDNINIMNGLSLVSIDSWDEFFDPPIAASVVRAHQNWHARLAAAIIAVQKGDVAVVLPDSPCWTCMRARLAITEQQLRGASESTKSPGESAMDIDESEGEKGSVGVQSEAESNSKYSTASDLSESSSEGDQRWTTPLKRSGNRRSGSQSLAAPNPKKRRKESSSDLVSVRSLSEGIPQQTCRIFCIL